MTIKQFEGIYRFLSNFANSPMIVDGKYYSCVENYYQSQKTLDEEMSERIRLAMHPGAAKRLGKQCELRDDWEKIKLEIMTKGLRAKFSRPDMREKLLATNNDTLEEGNDWGDRYWGKDLKSGAGKNMLGRMLMALREEIREDEANS